VNNQEPVVITLYLLKNDPQSKKVQNWVTEINSEGSYKIVEIYPEDDPKGGRFEETMPYLIAGPYQIHPPIEKLNVEIAMRAALERQKQLLESHNEEFIRRKERGKNFSQSDRTTLWITRHYMFLINLFLFLYIFLPFLAPTFMKMGWDSAAKAVYTIYKPLCHQFAFRSWFLFGEQPVYPLASAPLSYSIKYEDLVGHTHLDPLEARNYNGTESFGYKVALCERDIALWGSLLVTGIIFSLTGRRWKRIPFLLWIFLGVLPILLDGGSQFLNSLFPFFPARESTPLLRSLTGILFGTLTGMMVFPLIEESMNDTRQILYRKKIVSETPIKNP
jgi:uncharacterized membrane protein